MNTPPFTTQETQHPSSVDFRGWFFAARERAWVIALCFAVAAAATVTVLVRSPKIYIAKSVLLVEQEEAKVLNIQRIQREDLQTLESLKTVEQTLQNQAFIARVLDNNDLMHDARFAPVSLAHAASREGGISQLASMVEVKLRKGTRLIDIKVEHTNPALAALVANSLVKEFIGQNYEQNSSASRAANEFLAGEAQGLKRKLEASENALQNYKEQTKSVSFEDRQNTVLANLAELNVKATEAKSQRIICETAYKQVQALGTNIDALLVTPAAGSPAIKEIRSSIARAESDFANLKQRYREKHPKYIQAQSHLAEWKNALQTAILELPQTALSAYQSARAAEQAMDQALREVEVAALDLNQKAIHYNVLARDAESDRALFQSVLNRIKENSVTQDLKSSKVRIIEAARIPEKPGKPDRHKIVMMGLLGGLMSSIAFVSFLNALDQSLKTVDEAESCLGLPVLGALPKFPALKETAPQPDASADVHSPKAECFRTLRTSLSMLGRKDDRKVFLFTSALPQEGKSFCSLNYAFSLAQQGFKTVIIDCDLRRPMIEKLLLKNNRRAAGLTDYLTGHKTFETVVHTAEKENLSYIPAGSHAPNPAELLAKTQFDSLVDEALSRFDRVVIDSAPINVVSDTLLILNRVQTVCLVIRAHHTPKHSVRRVVQALQTAGAPLAGVVLNLMPQSGKNSYYYDYAYRGDYAESTH
jgi:capsular exopolysaccharide synthesis family protein